MDIHGWCQMCGKGGYDEMDLWLQSAAATPRHLSECGLCRTAQGCKANSRLIERRSAREFRWNTICSMLLFHRIPSLYLGCFFGSCNSTFLSAFLSFYSIISCPTRALSHSLPTHTSFWKAITAYLNVPLANPLLIALKDWKNANPSLP